MPPDPRYSSTGNGTSIRKGEHGVTHRVLDSTPGAPMTHLIRLFALGATLSFASACYTPPQRGPSRTERAVSRNAGESEPIYKLPPHVPALPGQLTLFADYEHAHEDGILLYIINRTDQNLAFSPQGDGDPCIRLESRREDGAFERAQLHIPSDCGNSYFYWPIVKHGEFSRILGYQPARGERRSVRYRMYLNEAYVVDDNQSSDLLWRQAKMLTKIPIEVVSNIGQGLVDFQEIKAARYDSLAIRFGDYETVKDMAIGRVKATAPEARWSRNDAIEALARFSTDSAAELVHSMVEDDTVSESAVYSLAKLGMVNAEAETYFQALLQGKDSKLRATAIAALTSRPISPAIIEFAKARLAEQDPIIRTGAINLLAQIANDHPAARHALLEHNRDPDPKIREIVEGVCKQWKR